MHSESPSSPPDPTTDRRGFLSTTSTLAMATGLVAGYGTFVAMAGRFLYPAGPSRKGWMFVARVESLRPGESLVYRAPSGATVVVARQADHNTVDDFIALSSVCPHLGCQVHWESQNDRFFCPCHNGVFNPQGLATGGPPFDAGKSLSHYPLRIEDGLLFIEVPLESVASDRGLAVVDPAAGERQRLPNRTPPVRYA
jgi:Rieske Fe-S protein